MGQNRTIVVHSSSYLFRSWFTTASITTLQSPTNSTTSKMTGKIIRPAPAEIEFKNMRFLITEQPQDATIDNYIKILKEHRVTHLVCATDPTYKTDDLGEAGVSVTEI